MPEKSITLPQVEANEVSQQDEMNDIITDLGAVMGVCPDQQLIDVKIKAKELGLE